MPNGRGDGRIDLLQESRFWIRIFKEHALFIKLGLPCDRTDLINEAQTLFDELSALETELMARRNLDSRLAQEIAATVSELIEFKERVLRMQIQCEMYANLFPLLIDHIRREAVRFLELLRTGRLTPPGPNLLAELIDTLVFWLRIMREHIDFIRQVLDPSERALVMVLENLETRFSDALETARELRSMSEVRPDYFNRAIRFAEEIEPLVRELRDLKAQAFELLLQCRILSAVSSPLLLDHVRREADKFLEDLRVIRQELQRFESPS
ncbi:MAG TPA: DUF2935 domain-containing protein [Firmicutes bacterium]|nr:DUF2935 domain-containing protein [Candidatus Fermentithermobacillaceae bacterium]